MKKLLSLFVLFLMLFALPFKAQYNPYLDKKRKNKPSVVMARDNKKTLKHQKRLAKKQMRKSKRKVKSSRR
jgi:hypothetical protein